MLYEAKESYFRLFLNLSMKLAVAKPYGISLIILSNNHAALYRWLNTIVMLVTFLTPLKPLLNNVSFHHRTLPVPWFFFLLLFLG